MNDKYTYFAQRGEKGAIKIGKSKYPDKRIKTLQTAMPEPLTLLLTIDEYLCSEKEAHNKFAHLRINGEWFNPEQELIDYIETKKACLATPVDPEDLIRYDEKRMMWFIDYEGVIAAAEKCKVKFLMDNPEAFKKHMSDEYGWEWFEDQIVVVE